MLKINLVLMLLIVCNKLHMRNAEILKCIYKNVGYTVGYGNVHSCEVTAFKNPFDNITVTGTNYKDVKAVYIHHTATRYIPADIGQFFSLTGLAVQVAELGEIRSNDFLKMQDLEYLSLYGNKLTSIPSDAFSKLPNLKGMNLQQNQFKHISSGVFDKLTNLDNVYFQGNICVNKQYLNKGDIFQMKRDIKENCYNSIALQIKLNELLEKIINSGQEINNSNKTTTNQEINNFNEKFVTNCKNPIEAVDVKINDIIGMTVNQEELKKMINQLLKTSENLQMEFNENIKLRAELSTAKNEQVKDRNENVQLKKDLSEAREIIEQKVPKMEQTINDFYLEVDELKMERHNERTNSIELRERLMKANEQLATCGIDERF